MITYRKLRDNETVEGDYMSFDGKKDEDVFIWEKDGEVVGYTWGYVTEDMGYNVFTMEMMEVFKKEEGLGTAIVAETFKAWDANVMVGSVRRGEGDVAYYFWLSLGADLDMDVDELEEYDSGEEIYFRLSR